MADRYNPVRKWSQAPFAASPGGRRKLARLPKPAQAAAPAPAPAKAPDEKKVSLPIAAAMKPVVLELEPGTYYWCRCGRSKSEKGLCDSSHKGTGITPLEFKIDEAKKVAICQCKATGNPPYCDGTHAKLAKT